MLKFKNLILSIINENDTVELEEPPAVTIPEPAGQTKTVREWFFIIPTSTTTEPASSEDVTKTSNTTMANPSALSAEIKKLESSYVTAYGPGSFPSVDDLTKIMNVWRRCWSRTSASQFFEYAQYMPFIELMAQVANLVPGNPNVDDRFLKAQIPQTAFDLCLTKFTEALTNKPTANPIDFPIATAEGQYVASQIKKHIQTNFVGQITLDKYPGNTIKEAIFYILEARKKARLATLSTSTVPDQGKAVLDILLEPDKFAGGNNAFSSKVSSDKIYTRAIHTELLGIGLSARRLFDAECMRLFKKSPDGKGYEGAGPITTSSAYEVFLNNGSHDEKNYFAFADDEGGHSVSAADIGEGGYIISNLKAASQKNEPVKDLYEKLTDCLLYTSPSPRSRQKSRMPSSA